MKTKKVTIQMILTALVILLTACGGADTHDNESSFTQQLYQQILELEALGFSISANPVFTDHDFAAVTLAVTIRLNVIDNAAQDLTGYNGTRLLVDTVYKLANYMYERGIPFNGMDGLPFVDEAIADAVREKLQGHPLIESTLMARYHASRRIEDYLAQGNMLWLEDFGVEVEVFDDDAWPHPPEHWGHVPFPQFIKVPGTSFGINDEESLIIFMDAVEHIQIMYLGMSPHIDEAILNAFATPKALGEATLLYLFREGMRARYFALYRY